MTENLPAPPEQRRRRVPPKVRSAITEIVEGRAKTITAAAKKVGLSRERLSRALGEPQCASLLRDKAARAVAIGAGRASARINQLIDSSSQKVSLDAAKHVLAVAGIRASPETSLNVNADVKAGYIIDLSLHGQTYRDTSPARLEDVIVNSAELPAPAADE